MAQEKNVSWEPVVGIVSTREKLMGFFLVIMLLHICYFSVVMLLVMLYFSGSHMPQKGDYAPAYATFRCLCHILCSDFGVKYALKRQLCYCCSSTAV